MISRVSRWNVPSCLESTTLATMQDSLVRVRKIDEVASMRENVLRVIAKLFHPCFETRSVFSRQRGRRPFPLRLDKQCECIGPAAWIMQPPTRTRRGNAPNARRVHDGILHAPSCGDVCADFPRRVHPRELGRRGRRMHFPPRLASPFRRLTNFRIVFCERVCPGIPATFISHSRSDSGLSSVVAPCGGRSSGWCVFLARLRGRNVSPLVGCLNSGLAAR